MQERIVIVGDVQIKNQEPFKSSIFKFFQFLKDVWDSENTIFIFLGDLFETSASHNVLIDQLLDCLLKLNKVILLTGNHDAKVRQRGNILLPFRHHEKIKVIEDPEEIKINDLSFLFIPFLYYNQKETVENLKGTYDFICTHVEHSQFAFDKENSITFNNELKGTFIHGHIHLQKDYQDIFENDHYIIGCPIPTKHLEDKQNHRIAIIQEDKKVKFENIPTYFKYVDLNYGEFPENKADILNVKEAPSIPDVLTLYKDYFVRTDGIELKVGESSEQSLSFDLSDLKEKFYKFEEENALEKDLKNICLEYL